MIQIENTLVSLDVIEQFFCCNLEKCKGQCCVEGDAGAPITSKEADNLTADWKKAECFMLQQGIDAIKKNGVGYIDDEGDLVTTIVNGKDCAFTCYDNDICLCALEKAYRTGNCNNLKPVSCALYPIRITEYPTFTAINYHKWNVCEPAVELGIKKGIRVYQFLKDPLVNKFGKDWYDELTLTAQIFLEEKKK